MLRLDRGTLAPGAPADVTILDPERSLDVRRESVSSKSRNSPFDGTEFRGGPVATIVNGAIVWRHDPSKGEQAAMVWIIRRRWSRS